MSSSSGVRPDAAAEVVETHISVIVLVGDRALKVKKAVRLPFVDWTDRIARLEACHREVALNRRLAPDVYLDVADVVVAGEPLDHLVVMRRMPRDRRLSTLVRSGADVAAALEELAALLARFHAAADRSATIDAAAGRDEVRRNWEDNLEVLWAAADRGALDAALVEEVGRRAGAYLDGRAALFAARAAAGCVVDGHGDLLADDVYLLDDGPRVLDCIDFSDRLRSVDVLDDVAFLAMDLERLGAPELAEGFVRAYERHSPSAHPATLRHHFVAYRAGVRAKVACIRAEQGGDGAADEARRLLELAARHLDAGRVRLVLVGGLPGTGKSTLATELSARTGWSVLASDPIRKELLGAEPAQSLRSPFGEGAYSAERRSATYRELLERARRHLEAGAPVVCDASWTDPDQRDAAARVAAGAGAEVVALWCEAPTGIAEQRLRARGPRHPSDATPDIAARMAASAPPWPDATTVPTGGPLTAALDVASAAVGPW